MRRRLPTANGLLATILAAASVLGGVSAVDAATIRPIEAKKLLIVDRAALNGTAKALFLAKDPAITKGRGVDPSVIHVRLDVRFDSASGAFVVPAGAFDGSAGWKVNNTRVAKYVNAAAPLGPSDTKVALVSDGKRLKLIAKDLGEEPLEAAATGAPSGDVYVAYTVDNFVQGTCDHVVPPIPCTFDVECPAGSTCFNPPTLIQHCSVFPVSSCTYRPVAGGAGAKLSCKGALPDPTCTAVP